MKESQTISIPAFIDEQIKRPCNQGNIKRHHLNIPNVNGKTLPAVRNYFSHQRPKINCKLFINTSWNSSGWSDGGKSFTRKGSDEAVSSLDNFMPKPRNKVLCNIPSIVLCPMTNFSLLRKPLCFWPSSSARVFTLCIRTSFSISIDTGRIDGAAKRASEQRGLEKKRRYLSQL